MAPATALRGRASRLRQLSLLALQHEHGRFDRSDVLRRLCSDPRRDRTSPPRLRMQSLGRGHANERTELRGDRWRHPCGRSRSAVVAGATRENPHLGRGLARTDRSQLTGPQGVRLGLNTIEDYVAHSPSFGAVPGRFANRIANGRFVLDGVAYQLDRKPGEKHTLHGGPRGFGQPHLEGRRLTTTSSVGAVCSIRRTATCGFPGELTRDLRLSVA